MSNAEDINSFFFWMLDGSKSVENPQNLRSRLKVLTYPAVGEGSEGKHQPDPEADVEIEGVDAVDGDEAQDCRQVAERLQREQEQINKQLQQRGGQSCSSAGPIREEHVVT